MSDKLTRKEMRSPDRFQRLSTSAAKWMVERKQLLIYGATALVVLLLVVGIFRSMGAQRKVDEGAALAYAMDAMRQGVKGLYDPSADKDLPEFDTAKARYEEISRRLELVLKEHADSKSAITAKLLLADADQHLGRLESAETGYNAFLAATDAKDPRRVAAFESLGYLYESRKDWGKATEAFDKMAAAAGGDKGKAEAAFHKARILELSGKKDEARAAFQKVKDDFKDAPAARLAGDRLTMQTALPSAQ